MRHSPLPGLFLWLEALLLSGVAIWSGSYWLLPFAAVALLLGSLLTRGISLAIPLALAGVVAFGMKPIGPATLPTALMIAPLLAGAACAFVGIIASLGGKTATSPLSACLARLAVILHFSSAGFFLASAWLGQPAHLWCAWLLSGFAVIIVADSLMKLLGRLYTPRRLWSSLAAPGTFFFFRWLGPAWRECLPAKSGQDQDDFALRLNEMWMWPVVRRSLLPLILVALLIAWLASAVHEVPAGHAGVRHRCGAWDAQALQPGMHLSLPWPLGGVSSVDIATVHQTVLGFRSDPGQPILWGRAHYEQEQRSLVGSGDDLLSISVPVSYRVESPIDYLKGSHDAEILVRDLAERLLLRHTLRRPASEVMATAREELRAAVQHDLQDQLDQEHSGIRITAIYLRDIHPPVEVAPKFQEVVSAMEEKEAFLHEGESYRRDVSTRAEGDAKRILLDAGALADSRLARAQGESARFSLLGAAWAANRPLYQLREGFRAFDDALAGAKKAIIDEKLRGAIPAHVDLRKVLNPDLLTSDEITKESLVPRPVQSRDEFDLDIEGFLRMDRGEVPAVQVRQNDGDNLLNTQQR